MHRLVGREGDNPPAIRNSLYGNPLIHHRFRYARVPFPVINRIPPHHNRVFSMGLCRRPNHGTHVRLVFVRHCLPGGIDHSRRPDIRPFAHINLVTGNGYQRACGCRIVVYKNPYRHSAIQYQAPERVGIYHHSAVSIHIDNHLVCPRLLRLGKRPTSQPPSLGTNIIPDVNPVNQFLRLKRKA